MPKKSRLDAKTIFTKVPYRDFMKCVHDRHPEIIRHCLPPRELLDPPNTEFLRSYRPAPGVPYQIGEKTEWDVWYCYYIFCQSCDIELGYDEMTRLINRVTEKDYSEIYVKKKFIEISNKLQDEVDEWEFSQK